MGPSTSRRSCRALALVAVALVGVPGSSAAQIDFVGGAAGQTAPRLDVAPTLAWLGRQDAVLVKSPAHTAWTTLEFLANGSTVKAGTYRAHVRALVRSLQELQDPDGRFVAKGQACTRTDQLVGALAMLAAWERSGHRPLQRPAILAVTAALGMFLADGAEPATAPEAALLALLLPTAERQEQAAAAIAPGVRERAATILAKLSFGPSRGHDAALQAGRLLLGERHPIELTLARAWPVDLAADPWHTFFAVTAVGGDPLHVAPTAASFDRLLAQRTKDGDAAGSWTVGGRPDAMRTAMLATALGFANGSPLVALRR